MRRPGKIARAGASRANGTPRRSPHAVTWGKGLCQPLFLAFTLALLCRTGSAAASQPALHFEARTPEAARTWQRAARAKLFELMMGGAEPERCPLQPRTVQRIEVPEEGIVLEEITLQTLPDRRAHAWLSRPAQPRGKVGAVLAINGHGGSGEQVIRGQGLYWYGAVFSRMGCVVMAPDVGQHQLQHTNWSLMGERTWDALRCVDHLLSLPEVDPARLAVAGLSLGGETTMYVAALDERLRMACSSGWLTTVANMKNGHCPCFNFPGLEEHFEFSDIFSCIAPRLLVCELGRQERAPGGFPVETGRLAWAEIRRAYRVFHAESNLILTVHPGPHVFHGGDFLPKLRQMLGDGARPLPDDAAAAAWCRFVNGPEQLDGTAYYWLGRDQIALEFEVVPQVGDALELAWGAKGDERDALLRVNGKPLPVRAGGHWGFRWIRITLPPDLEAPRYHLEFKAGSLRPAFLSEVRLVRAAAAAHPPDLQPALHKSVLKVGS